MVMATQTALQADGDLLDTQERSRIDVAMQALLQAKSGDDAANIESVSKALAQATEAFAAMRMNRGIASALAGKNIEAL
jgi:molecular chaperone HscA